MQYHGNDSVQGPTGEVMIASNNTLVKIWSAFNDAPKGRVDMLGATITLDDSDFSGRQLKFCCVERAFMERPVKAGDSGSLVAWDQSRHVMGVQFAGDFTYDYNGNPVFLRGSYYTRAGEIQTAFRSAGTQFTHYWGNSSSSFYWRPSVTRNDTLTGPGHCD